MSEKRLSGRRLKEIRSLTRKKGRDRLGESIVEGFRGVTSAIRSGVTVREIIVTREAADRGGLPFDVDVPVHVVSSSDVASLSSVEAAQGILAVVKVEILSPEALLGTSRVLALDGIRDPGNAGTLIRTAAWFGVDAVVTSPGTVDLYNPKVVRAAMGGLWGVEHVHVDDLPELLETLREEGFAAYGADMEGTSPDHWTPEARSVLVFGSEAHGLSRDVRDRLEGRVHIPGGSRREGAESLNVSVAAGILMYEWMRKP